MEFEYEKDLQGQEKVLDYQNTCIDFINDISKDYKDWVDRYNLEEAESNFRKTRIQDIIQLSSLSIKKYGDTIKKIDIIMNDAINKMAETTAGYPFVYNIFVKDKERYISHSPGRINFNIKAAPKKGEKVRIGKYSENEIVLLNSTSEVQVHFSDESFKPSEILNDIISIDCSSCQIGEILSITIIVEELKNEMVYEKRGLSTLVLIK